jgi:hypothetical protein
MLFDPVRPVFVILAAALFGAFTLVFEHLRAAFRSASPW